MAFLFGFNNRGRNNSFSSSSSDDDDVFQNNNNNNRDARTQEGDDEMDTTQSHERSALTAVLEGDMDSEADQDDRPAIENVDQVAKEQRENLDEKAKQLAAIGMCCECGDQPASLTCTQCQDCFCSVCFGALHRNGNRAKHTTTPLASSSLSSSSLPSSSQQNQNQNQNQKEKQKLTPNPEGTLGEIASSSGNIINSSDSMDSNGLADDIDTDASSSSNEGPSTTSTENPNAQLLAELAERCRYIPLRLTFEERKKLRLLEATLNVSEYTDKIDIYSYKSKTARIHAQIHDICAILSGLIVASDYRKGQQLIQDHEFKDNERFFQSIFEIGRRYKIMNPERMRDSYGKLIYMLMDSVTPDVQQLLQFSCVVKVSMVHDALSQSGCEAILQDQELLAATAEIVADRYPNRYAVEVAIKTKERAIERLVRRYSREHTGRHDAIAEEDLRRCLYSMSDSNAYLRANRDPCLKMIHYLQTYFRSDTYVSNFSLAIVGGHDGARLTHSHSTQYAYVLQSLTLWSIIADEMFKLWFLSEEDLLDDANMYRLCDTGQGLNRVQRAPRVGKAMQRILYKAQQKLGSWVGSSVVHLGDHAVPNSFSFIDKYTQISRILNPILIVISRLDEIAKDRAIRTYINGRFGSVDMAKKLILSDFFRHGFDGSGADNFYDAGSCIDGRLTSAWNWCMHIEKKSFFPLFLLTGFTGFDGAF